MPVIYQKFINREDLQANPDVYYVFGDNDLRIGRGGQAAAMRGEPNAIGIRTKWSPGTDPSAYFLDAYYDDIVELIDEDFDQVESLLKEGRIIVWPIDGVGTGLALLEKNAPKVLAYINEKKFALDGIQPNYENKL